MDRGGTWSNERGQSEVHLVLVHVSIFHLDLQVNEAFSKQFCSSPGFVDVAVFSTFLSGTHHKFSWGVDTT